MGGHGILAGPARAGGGAATLHAHALAVEAAFAAGAGLEPAGRAIRALAADDEVPGLLAAHGIVAAERAGRLRVSFHLNNTEEEAAAGRGAAPRARRAAEPEVSR